MSNSQVLSRFGAKLHAHAVVNTASGLPINVEGHFCKMLTVQAVPTPQCLRLGLTESVCQSLSAVRYTIDAQKYAKRYDFVGVTTQTRSIITVRLSLGNFHGDNARVVWCEISWMLDRQPSANSAGITSLAPSSPNGRRTIGGFQWSRRPAQRSPSDVASRDSVDVQRKSP